ncbi:MAG: TIGR00266 family protein [Gammaproteobacteria bacterium]|nr:TIGR00266 family protein [Gammaproteobacteria bacterium]MYF03086.1 TIGR00266 family protein [Gammaproteobacteria bacterium]MYI76964.1 TIGR00266 family protein [Gammaproteobacteria bacterium]
MAHVIDCEIKGSGGNQYVVVDLDPQETVIAEAGAMFYIDPEITFEAKMGDGTTSGLASLFGAVQRKLANESLFLTHFTNQGYRKQSVAFAGPHLGEILTVDLANYGNTLLCQKSAFLAAALGTKLSIAFTSRMGAGFLGGEGFVLTKLDGDGMVMLHAGGSLLKRELRGETLRVDTGCVVAMDSGIDYNVQAAGNLKSMMFGGEGLFLATLSGHGTVWLQTMPFARLAATIQSELPSRT